MFLTQVGVERASRAVEAYLIHHQPRRLILAGFGGALRPETHVGDVIIARDVISEDGTVWPCDGTGTGRVLTVSRMIASVPEKLSLGNQYAATVCDMESAAVAAVCARHGVPFVAVRAISDSATRSLSPTLDKLIVNGQISYKQTLRAILTEPTILGDFWHLARGTRCAATNLAVTLDKLLHGPAE